MISGDDSDSISIDLILEILSRLPGKSIARFRCVSKLWGSMLLSPYFNHLFLTRSSARPPRLLFAVEQSDGWCFFTSPMPQPQNPYEKSSSSLVVTADFHMKFPGDNRSLTFCGHASGFIHFLRHNSDPVPVPVICNPTTEQYVNLPLPSPPKRTTESVWVSFLGFDPVEKQFKVLCINKSRAKGFIPGSVKKEEPDQILTLETRPDSSWRKIQCPLDHRPYGEGICINGVLYYLAINNNGYLIVCFDVRFETFSFIYKDFIGYHNTTKVINYKGKFGVISLEYNDYQSPPKLCMWVIKDVEKPESSEWVKCFSFSCWDDVDIRNISIDGVTARGEVVLSTKHAFMPFFVFFFLNLEMSTLQRVQIRGFGAIHFDNYGRVENRRVKVIVDHVEDLKFVTMKTTCASTSITPPELKTTSSKAHRQQEDRRRSMVESVNKFDSLLLDDD